MPYHANDPKGEIVHEKPSLLSEAHGRLWLCHASTFRKRNQEIVHDGSTQAGEYDYPRCDHFQVIRPGIVKTGRLIVVGEREEGCRGRPQCWEEDVCEGEKEKAID